ncbi:MAG TPA: hypothetical protein VK484_04965 [Ferruginibacter sp.]|nr:hypothetical protein [Ferruginibacter sp.]
MLYLVRNFLTSLFLALFLFAVAGCNTGEKEVKEEYDNYKFDQQVIDKLPLYDSLVSAIIANFPSFQKFIKDDDSYRSFRYIPSSEDPDVFIKLPPEAAPSIAPYYDRIGKELIYGFDVFKDSSVKIHVRTRLTSNKVDIAENLSYYSGGNIRDREFPEKDSTLNKNWQYWARFDKRDPF